MTDQATTGPRRCLVLGCDAAPIRESASLCAPHDIRDALSNAYRRRANRRRRAAGRKVRFRS